MKFDNSPIEHTSSYQHVRGDSRHRPQVKALNLDSIINRTFSKLGQSSF